MINDPWCLNPNHKTRYTIYKHVIFSVLPASRFKERVLLQLREKGSFTAEDKIINSAYAICEISKRLERQSRTRRKLCLLLLGRWNSQFSTSPEQAFFFCQSISCDCLLAKRKLPLEQHFISRNRMFRQVKTNDIIPWRFGDLMTPLSRVKWKLTKCEFKSYNSNLHSGGGYTNTLARIESVCTFKLDKITVTRQITVTRRIDWRSSVK